MPKWARQFALVVRFQLRLRTGQRTAERIVNEVERQERIAPVAEAVEELQRPDARVEHAVAALGVHVFRRITGHGGDDLHAVFGQELGHAVEGGFEQDRQVAAVHDVPARGHGGQPFHEVAEIGDHLRRAAGQVDHGDVGVFEPAEDAVGGFARHDFLALGPGVDVAMRARQVAELADVDLQDARLGVAQRQGVRGEGSVETVHGGRTAGTFNLHPPRRPTRLAYNPA